MAYFMKALKHVCVQKHVYLLRKKSSFPNNYISTQLSETEARKLTRAVIIGPPAIHVQ